MNIKVGFLLLMLLAWALQFTIPNFPGIPKVHLRQAPFQCMIRVWLNSVHCCTIQKSGMSPWTGDKKGAAAGRCLRVNAGERAHQVPRSFVTAQTTLITDTTPGCITPSNFSWSLILPPCLTTSLPLYT